MKVCGQVSHPNNFTPGGTAVPTKQGVGWASEPVWTWWWKGIFQIPTGNEPHFSGHPSHTVGTILTDWCSSDWWYKSNIYMICKKERLFVLLCVTCARCNFIYCASVISFEKTTPRYYKFDVWQNHMVIMFRFSMCDVYTRATTVQWRTVGTSLLLSGKWSSISSLVFKYWPLLLHLHCIKEVCDAVNLNSSASTLWIWFPVQFPFRTWGYS